MDEQLFRGHLDTPLGRFLVVATHAGVRRIVLPGSGGPGDGTDPSSVSDDPDHRVVALACGQLRAYFEGTRHGFDMPLDLRGTEFQVTAWRALATIGYGDTASYAEQAARIGRPRAVRAVGSANRCNPVPVVLPCHRVIGADGSLTGYAGGIGMKKWLLDHEARGGPAPDGVMAAATGRSS
jgi:methylated-DNA-[protein]-cysteine S-methyltransferase